MKILAFDVSKKSTGWAFYDGEFCQEGVGVVEFKDTVQWDIEIKELIDTWDPDIAMFSETVNRMCSHSTKRIMFGLMYHLEHICRKRGINIVPINDNTAKKSIGVVAVKAEEPFEIETTIIEKAYGETETKEKKVYKKGWRSKQLKEKTLKWANKQGVSVEIDDIADAMSFAYYLKSQIV